MKHAILGAAAILALTACMASEAQLRTRAAADFQCDADKLDVKTLPKGVYAVSGCDQKDTYVYNGEASAWVRESEAGGKVITLPR